MATVLGTSYFDSYANYQLAYDLLSQDISTNSSRVRLYGILNVSGNSIGWSSGTVSVHTESQGIGTSYSRGSYIVIQRDFTFYHDGNGNFSAYIGASINTTYKSGSTGGTLTLPKIDRVARTDSVEGSDIDGNFKVNYTKYIPNYTYKLRISIPNVVELEKIDYNTSGEVFTLSNTTIQDLYSRIGTSNSISLGFAVETYSGSTTISRGNEVIITGRLLNANPIFSDFEFEDTNARTLALTGDSTKCIIGYSNIKAIISTINKAEAQKGATMSKYRFVVGNTSSDIAYSSDSEVSSIITKVESGTFNVYAIDSRNNSTLVTKLATSEITYTPLYVDKQNCKIERNDNRVGANAILTLNGSVWNGSFGDVTNSITSVTYKFKKTNSSQWITGTTTITPTISDNSFTFTGQIASDNLDTTWDLDSSYNIQVTINDELSNGTVEFVLNSAIPTISIDRNGVGIMCAYDSSIGGSLQVNGERIDVSDVYSTSEVKTNKVWIDNKPIYRKVVAVNFPSTSSASVNTNHNISNIDKITHYWLTWYDTADNRWFNYYKDTSGSYYVQIDGVTSTVVTVKANNTGVPWDSRTTNKYAVIEYTKTID